MCQKNLVKPSKIKFHDSSFSLLQVVEYGKTDGHTDMPKLKAVIFKRSVVNSPKIRIRLRIQYLLCHQWLCIIVTIRKIACEDEGKWN